MINLSFLRHFLFLKQSCFHTFIRTFRIKDKNFEYFRRKDEYKNLVIQLNSLNQSNLAGPGFSFLVKNDDIQSDGFFYHLMQRENVMRLNNVQIKEVLCLIANTEIDVIKYSTALKYLDEKCAVSAERWPLDLSLYVLDAWFIILGPKAFRKHYYSAVTSLWSRRMKKCSKYNLVLMLYFIGMSKLAPPFIMEMLEDKIENSISNFTDEELAIICLSFFKTSKKINSNVILQHSCNAAKTLLLKDDRFNLISILKCLRLSNYFDVSLWKELNHYIMREHKSFNFVECTNFLATFAAQNVYNNEIFNCLEDHCITVLSQEELFLEENKAESNLKAHPSVKSRSKDFSRFLWSLSTVNHNVKNSTLVFMTNILQKRLEYGDFESNWHNLVDCLQSFVILCHYPQSLLEYVFQPSFYETISNMGKAKPKYQMFFVQKSVQIEYPNICLHKCFNALNHIPKNLQKDTEERKGFAEILSFMQHNMDDEAFTCCYIMPHIMIAGIVINMDITKIKPLNADDHLFFDKIEKLVDIGLISKQIKPLLQSEGQLVCLEILDPSVCIHESDKPLGLLETKIRHLKKLNFNVVTLTLKDIDKFIHSNEFDHFLKTVNLL